ncbi:MAG: PadR family transcriptional regulator [Longimicrobiales bacterium]|nr:PadR family transcriptional regulator [Longimicrobiales bacterium]
MPSDFVSNWQTQARKGILVLSVLNALRGERLYGYEIVKRLGDVAGLSIAEGTIYPLMSRLQKEGLVESSLEPSPEGPARKYYRLTADGEAALDRIDEAWDDIVEGVEALRRKHDEGGAA